MEKKKVYSFAGIAAAFVAVAAICAALLIVLRTSGAASASAETSAVRSGGWENGEMLGGDIWVRPDLYETDPGVYMADLGFCPECGAADNSSSSSYARTEVAFSGDCMYSYVHWGPRATRVHEGTVYIHDGEAFTREATTTQEGAYGVRCKDCGEEYVIETYPKLCDHVYDSGTTVSANELYCADTRYTCEKCDNKYYALSGTSARTAHEGEILSETPSTCSRTGTRKMYCKTCEFEWTETLPLAEHTYPEPGVETKPATCEEDGIMTYACTVCSGGVYAEPIPMLGHDPVQFEAESATCTEAGHGPGMKCSRCEKIIIEALEFEPLGHDWGEWEDDRSSCEESGTRTRVCTRCEEEETEPVVAGAHTWNKGEVTQEATCTQSGVKTLTCVVCGETQTETVEPIGHIVSTIAAVAPTCSETGLTAGSKCSVCGVILEAQQVLPAKGHTLKHIKAVEPTETLNGNIEYWHCSTCGKYYADQRGASEISLEDTVWTYDEFQNEGMEWWQILLAVVAGVAVLGVAAVLLDKYVFKSGVISGEKSPNKKE